MKKKVLACFFLAIMVISLNAQAVETPERRIVVTTPTLEFNGTTAVCGLSIAQSNKKICATMELWQGKELIDSWSGEGNGSLLMSETCAASKGKTYTLKAYGTIGSKAFVANDVSRVC